MESAGSAGDGDGVLAVDEVSNPGFKLLEEGADAESAGFEDLEYVVDFEL